jgi:hypothetical protein
MPATCQKMFFGSAPPARMIRTPLLMGRGKNSFRATEGHPASSWP